MPLWVSTALEAGGVLALITGAVLVVWRWRLNHGPGGKHRR
jgi:hypothetical protein